MPDISRRAQQLGTENAFVVLAEVNALARQGKDIVSFCIGQPDFPAPEHVQEAAIRAIKAGKHGYTPSAGIDELRAAAAKYLAASESGNGLKVFVAGKGPAGLIAAYAAALDDSIAGVTIVNPPASHMDAAAPQFLNVLRVCDVPDALGLIAPRTLSIVGSEAGSFSKTTAAYEAAEAKERLTIK